MFTHTNRIKKKNINEILFLKKLENRVKTSIA